MRKDITLKCFVQKMKDFLKEGMMDVKILIDNPILKKRNIVIAKPQVENIAAYIDPETAGPLLILLTQAMFL